MPHCIEIITEFREWLSAGLDIRTTKGHCLPVALAASLKFGTRSTYPCRRWKEEKRTCLGSKHTKDEIRTPLNRWRRDNLRLFGKNAFSNNEWLFTHMKISLSSSFQFTTVIEWDSFFWPTSSSRKPDRRERGENLTKSCNVPSWLK